MLARSMQTWKPHCEEGSCWAVSSTSSEGVLHALHIEHLPNFVARASSWLVFFQNPKGLGAQRLIDGTNITAPLLRASTLEVYLGMCLLIVCLPLLHPPVAIVRSLPGECFPRVWSSLVQEQCTACSMGIPSNELRGLDGTDYLFGSHGMEACRSSMIGRSIQSLDRQLILLAGQLQSF
jgi:hypothetical protein